MRSDFTLIYKLFTQQQDNLVHDYLGGRLNYGLNNKICRISRLQKRQFKNENIKVFKNEIFCVFDRIHERLTKKVKYFCYILK